MRNFCMGLFKIIRKKCGVFFRLCEDVALTRGARAVVQIEPEMRDVLRKVGILPKWAIISKMVVGRRSWT